MTTVYIVSVTGRDGTSGTMAVFAEPREAVAYARGLSALHNKDNVTDVFVKRWAVGGEVNDSRLVYNAACPFGGDRREVYLDEVSGGVHGDSSLPPR